MYEDDFAGGLKRLGIEFVVSLPCDRTKDLCSLMERNFHYVNINREEDGVGICAGLALSKRRFVLHMQSSGLGNSLNAMMSLNYLYGLPLPVVASLRGYYKEKIPAQIPFNSKIPGVLDALGIKYTIIEDSSGLKKAYRIIDECFKNSEIHVILISPKVWEGEPCTCESKFPGRSRDISLSFEREIKEPVLTRRDAIKIISEYLSGEPAVCNIGVPCKELYAENDRQQNFYMLGSYTQATPIGLGLALGQKKHVYVIDGDGSLLGTAVLPVVAAENPKNLTIFALDNGAFGSTGMQITHSWNVCSLELMAVAAGIKDTAMARTGDDLKRVLSSGKIPQFVHVIIKPGNSDAKNIPLSPSDIMERFEKSI
ncbi:sulfopyruvate decarboxylase subunit beta [Methanomicrobium sp. W14]|jgi:sulfopyruvate decarboxylase beta subunit|uniref:sulfopyruvate decarboxylase subunit alpha n=1 Tax=Methanomicrobium sp. W14 TaxID=2817839 RepID=UPI001AE17AE8|nr:sulfopyruvate decarboxylase subunit alpha [Methanomicrobium sp. W14]MBP2133546.1 sulfopyruvate decarboxylase subunit beta [Methanomicrobium sp. W14]